MKNKLLRIKMHSIPQAEKLVSRLHPRNKLRSITDRNKNLDEMLSRRVEKIIPSKEGLKKLMLDRKIRLYQGFDPTGKRLHLGHSIGLRQLMAFAEAGHEVIFVFGTGTVLVGDPSQRNEARKSITKEEIDENIKDWKMQAGSIVDFSKITIKKNGDWLIPLTLKDIVKIASNISAVQLFKREMFQRRIKRGNTVWYHETMYPLLQGYDSVVMDVDLEIGGTDQEFNMLIGRELMRKMEGKEKYVLTTPMISGIDGKQMSKSSGNCVWLDDSPSDMFGKLMAVPDSQIVPYLKLVTDMPLPKVEEVRQNLKNHKINPRDAKEMLAQTVVVQFYGQQEAEKQQFAFAETFQNRKAPLDIPVYRARGQKLDLVNILVETKIASSRTDAKRLVSQGALEWDGQKMTHPILKIKKSGTLKIGKYRFLRIDF